MHVQIHLTYNNRNSQKSLPSFSPLQYIAEIVHSKVSLNGQKRTTFGSVKTIIDWVCESIKLAKNFKPRFTFVTLLTSGLVHFAWPFHGFFFLRMWKGLTTILPPLMLDINRWSSQNKCSNFYDHWMNKWMLRMKCAWDSSADIYILQSVLVQLLTHYKA